MILPHPWDYCYEWDGPYGTRKFSSASHNGARPARSVPIFTADQMRAYAAAAVEAEREQCAERVRLVSRIERLRGLCKTAVGMLHDAGRDDDAEVISELIGDMEV